LALLLVFASPSYACAQTKPAKMQPAVPYMEKQPAVPYQRTTQSKPTAGQFAEWYAHVKKCLGSYEPIRHPVSLSVTIGQDGMIAGDPEVASPIDDDEFRDDVKKVVKKLHQCEPLIVDPFGFNKGPFKQPVSVIDQLSKCPPLEFPQDKYSQVQRFTWKFSTVESAAAYK
jgi:hypothetical protein